MNGWLEHVALVSFDRGGAIMRNRPVGRARIIAPMGQAVAGKLVEPAGIEPATFWLQTRRSPS